jgi:glycine cleavage system H lipoate-binding protein
MQAMDTLLKQQRFPNCLWMQAGVVKKKSCHSDFACNTCTFDKALNRVCTQNKEMKRIGMHLPTKQASLEFWQERLQKMPLSQRPCIHHMKGHIEFKNCPKAYHCIDCEFDQYFHDQFKVNAVLKPVEFNSIHGISLPTGFYLHPGHTWAKLEDQGMVRVGLDDFTGRLLGKFDKIKVPLMGKTLIQGKPGFKLFRSSNSVDIVSPVSGVIAEVNSTIEKNPHLINESPYENG